MKIKNNKKIDAAPKNDAGGDEKHIYFFTLPYFHDSHIKYEKYNPKINILYLSKNLKLFNWF